MINQTSLGYIEIYVFQFFSNTLEECNIVHQAIHTVCGSEENLHQKSHISAETLLLEYIEIVHHYTDIRADRPGNCK